MSGRPGEFETIARWFAPLATGADGASLGLSDDAALLALPPTEQLAVTTDTLVEGVHFLTDDPPESLGWKVLSVNLSDLAAMGATPYAYTLSLTVTDKTDAAWLEAFAGGLKACQEQTKCSLIGGDTVSTPGPMVLTVTAFGRVPRCEALTRYGAQDGDDIYVSGWLGDAALGLQVLQGKLTGLDSELSDYLVDRYRRPAARGALGPKLRGLAHAALDVSDGLIQDLGHLSRIANLDMAVQQAALPHSPAATAALSLRPDLAPVIWSGGDDYELAFTAAPEQRPLIARLGGQLGLPLTRIGVVEPGSGLVRLLDGAGDQVDTKHGGWTHF